ncbi:MAG: CHAT domain-containing protein [Planctomycetota bacterium]|jgi:CHAT domain-containing protein/tetratricopeptide (TPR) repeat protein
MRPLWLALLIATLAAAQDQAKPDTPEQAADKVLAAFPAKDAKALKTLAEKDDPDPWLVADELCFRQEHDAADAFAQAAPRKDTEKLPAYVASRRGQPPNAAAREALAASHTAFDAKDHQSAWAALARAEASATEFVRVSVALGRGHVLRRLRRLEESTKSFVAAADLAEQLGWLARAAEALQQGGLSACYRADWPRGLAIWERCLALEKLRGNAAGVAKLLANLGIVHRKLGDFPRARERFERALSAQEALGDRIGVAKTLNNLGGLHVSLGNHQQALECFERSQKLAEELGNRSVVARTLNNIGSVHRLRGDYRKALGCIERAQKLAGETGDRPLLADTFANTGAIYTRLSDYPKALECFERSLELAQALGNRARVASALNNIGESHRHLGDCLQALEYYERARELAEKLGYRVLAAAALDNSGIAYGTLGDYPKALQYHQRSLRVREALQDRAGVAETLNNLGVVYILLGSYPKALESLERALATRQELGDRAGAAKALGNIGSVHERLGDYPRALAYWDRALKLAEELGDRAVVAMVFHNLAVIHRLRGDYPSALEYAERGRKLFAELGDRTNVAMTLDRIGSIHERRGDYPKALEYLERSRKLAEELGDRALVATTLANRGNVHAQLGNHAQAAEDLRQALALAVELGALELEVRALWRLTATHLARNEARVAADVAHRAVMKLSVLGAGLAEEEGASLRAQFAGVFALGAQAALQLGDTGKVSYFVESGRAGTLLEALGGRAQLQAAVIPEELRTLEAKARIRTRLALWHHRKALETGAKDPDTRMEVAAAREEILAVVHRIQREAKSQADLLYPKAVPLERIQATLREADALVLYALFAKEAVALVITAESARIVELGATKTIEGAVRALRDAVGHAGDRGIAVPSREARQGVPLRLRALVVEPLGLDKETKRVLVSPDGLLADVPFALLLPDKEVVYVPSGTTYGVLLDEQAKRGEGVLALGDPDYGGEAESRAVTVMRSGANLKRLPETAQEAKAVGDVVLLRGRATEATFASALSERKRWRAVHLACHGLVRPDQPQLSSLALTPDAEHDGFLSVLEVFRLKIPADLVVLSACETAKGKIYKAEGILGFTRAFMLAGAPRVIVSLWKVDDAATRALMVKFYELWKPGQMATATALKKAQEYVRSHEKWEHPYYWAAWQLWGLGD